jgi:tetratricopeptide (TPR) repeat protein
MTARCSRCGRPLVGGGCPACSLATLAGFVHREIVGLAVLIAIAGGAFVGTRAVARASTSLRHGDAAAWYDLGQQQLAAGRTSDAISSLGRASAMVRDRYEYRLALAAALEAAGQVDSARQVLAGVRERTPEDPTVNTRLARLEAGRGDVTAATRYYEHALHGSWTPDGIDERRRLQIELIHYLLSNNQNRRALAELLLLEVGQPDDAPAHLETARLFAAAGDPARALKQFELVLQRDAKNPSALAGAGSAAFRLGDYSRALEYLSAAPGDQPGVEEQRRLSALVLSRDPLRPRLRYAERHRRLSAALTHVAARLESCEQRVHGASIDEIQRLRADVGAAASRLARVRAPSLRAIENGLDVVLRIERDMPSSCGEPTLDDRALLLIGRMHEAGAQ